ncbi:SusD/RagB family nutrient-binding outer membrane lipoprotein [Bacteroides coprosuis]|uniref:SusD/RagB family nutrient-binding outer membrane lipoprotein n=1 Tax=Bacteroides coprosuis TaxID=151276 RepID=UPI001DABF0B4|nr:SusD/RagB family nutrient-binding outer membrane lipoprotein [Bacteroides coprosuis]HJD91838.1 SusD/RagB family nutrient-binding outer membrane lipoprotein [Bacteroides coprosuis]
MKKYIYLALIALLSACADYEDINSNIYGVTDSELKAGGLAYGSAFMKMQQLVIPIGSPDKTTDPGNDLQNTDLISSGNYIGYFGNNNNWGFNIESNWNFREDRMTYAYENFYSKLYRSWNDIYKEANGSEEPNDKATLALANIVKVAGWLRATDVFGPIVYTNAGKGSIAPKLDSQEDVYRAMLADLDESVEILKNYTSLLMNDYDVIYGGNTSKWVKFANSLMLRMSVRVHFKDQALAQEYIQKALDPANGGVIENIEEEAKIQSTSKMPLLNSIIASIDYGETRMGLGIWSYLTGYEDPRISKYFTTGIYDEQEAYLAVVPTNSESKKDTKNSPLFASEPNVNEGSPLYWMRASEVLLLKAEAALFGLISENPKQLYEEGVAMSFEENGVKGVEKYLKSNSKPTDINIDGRNYYYSYYSAKISEKNTSPNWNDMNQASNLSQKEQQFQKIITQKYLALYPNAVEAWTEYRRTGYPFILPPDDKNAPKRIGCTECLAPERFRYAPSEYSNNPNMNEIPSLLGGEDTGATKMWWVRADRPSQR